MIQEYVSEAPDKVGGRRGHSLPCRQYFAETSSLLTLSLNLFIKHSNSATTIQLKKYFFVTTLGLFD